MNINYRKKRADGFSLIELLIVIAIIGVLAAVAIPSYSDYMLKSRRADGVSFLTEVASEQIRFYSEYNRYTNSMADLGYGTLATAASKEGFYTVSIATANNNTSYTLTATPVTTGPQAKDLECAALSLNSSGQKTVSGTIAANNCW